MATLELLVEIDSDVHPELYALLASVGRASLRPERLRQLAAGGLIWEHLRAQPRLDAAASPALAEAARTADRSAIARAAVRSVEVPAVESVAIPVPAAPPEPPPVLQDVVEIAARPPRVRAAVPPRRLPPPRQAEAAPPAAAAPPEPLPEFAGGKKPGPRSRLLLMKERGLFKNG
ncbi:MAG: hypothetical protein KIT35_16005 [Piscinibacter sp.]|uniref:hypothetical protein n=1 Tax=Piscinibacter sp. TaxID=1903157 RepID=UPI00258E680B|nr:hypothetical protein [Piscinibacter sp.]MCW5665336.1 hypothetical protein [Piscinibacter sp.]